jgi:trehalose synthase
MKEVELEPRSLTRLERVALPSHLRKFRSVLGEVAAQLDGRTVWHVNSTSEGGGVAELLHQLLGYLIEGGIRCRWIVVEGEQDFFRVTKRLHNRLHGSEGDGGPLGEDEREMYMRVLRKEVAGMLALVEPGDVAVLHDPQTAGLIGPLIDAGLTAEWVCHVGVDTPTDIVRSAWAFLRPHVEEAHASVFSRRAYVWEGLDRRKVAVIPPCIDPVSPKNAELGPPNVDAVLGAARLLAVPEPADAVVEIDGVGAVTVTRKAETVEEAPVPPDAPLVAQVSRWDRLKDPVGVLRGFARHVPARLGAHLLLVGPETASVADDPEGAEVYAEARAAWQRLATRARARIHLVSLPVADRIENAVMVNALQRKVDVVVQKSLAEGFGLTVTEAMWKGRAIVASRVGGIQDQIVDGRSGILIAPADLATLGRSVSSLIADRGFAQAVGHAAKKRVRNRYLPPHFLGTHLGLLNRILTAEATVRRR